MRERLGVGFVLAGMIAALFLLIVPPSHGGEALDRSRLKLVFAEDFSQPPSFYDRQLAPNGRWKTNFFFGVQEVNDPKSFESRTLQPNEEGQFYGSPLVGMGSFEWKKGSLTIIGKPNPFAGDPRTQGQPYLSGLITTEPSFSQATGYFEARITMPVGKGLWPGFWLLPKPRMVNGYAQSVGAQEIDIAENIGRRDELYLTVFNNDDGKKVRDYSVYNGVNVDEPHTYGLLMTDAELVWYIDGREVRRRPNRDFHAPAYMLINLAVGGEWPGFPDDKTPMPARMRIDWVRAYKLVR